VQRIHRDRARLSTQRLSRLMPRAAIAHGASPCAAVWLGVSLGAAVWLGVCLCAAASLGASPALARTGSAGHQAGTGSAGQRAMASSAGHRRIGRRGAGSRPATASRTIELNETGHLRLVSKHNFTLKESGSASGTIKGAIYVRLTAISSSRVVLTVQIRPPGGSISGSGRGRYRRKRGRALFSGSMSFGHGKGRYSHAHGSGLRFSGVIEESHGDAITVHVRGTVSN